jgi:putative redox protein
VPQRFINVNTAYLAGNTIYGKPRCTFTVHETVQQNVVQRSDMEDSSLAKIVYAGDDLFVATTPSGHAQVLDTDTKRASAASPMELLLIALGSCTAVDVVSILRKKRERVTAYEVEVRGERRDEYPRGYRTLEVHHILRGHDLSAHAVETAIRLSEEKYCSVAATLRPAAEITSRFTILPATTDEEASAA